MKRSSTSLHFLASAAVTVEPAAISAMSLRPTSAYRGRGRNPGRNGRGFSDRPYSSDNEQFVTGDSHFQSVRDVNRGGGSYAGGNNNNNRQPQPYRPRPPPSSPSFNHGYSPRFNQNQNQQFRSPGPPPRRPNFSGDQLPFRPPHLDRNQQFRPPSMYFNQNQQFRQPPPRQFRPPQQRSKPLDYRNWEYAKPGPPPSCERFSVLSYNILADYLAVNHRGKLYFHIPRHILDWEFRKRNIIFELGLWSADILCFQEVDRFQDFEEELQNRGYRGIWKMRTGDPVDGCAIFWRSSRFNLLHEESIEFNKLGLRDNVAQICVLESINQKNNIGMSALPASSEGRNKVVICNIHVLFNPKRGEIKLGQVRVLLDKAYAVSKLWDDAPVVVCGDFNCTPKSSLYNFISEQKLNVCELPRDKISGQASAEIRPRMPYTPTLSVNDRVIRQNGSLIDIQEKINIDSKSDDRPTSSVTQPRVISSAQNISNADENSAPLCKSLEGCDKDDDCKNEVLLTSHFPLNSSNLSTNGSPDEHTLSDIEKSRGEALATSTTSYSSSSGNSKSNCCTEDGRLSIEKDMDCNNSTVATDQSKPIDSSNSDVTSSEPILATSFREDLEAFPPENFKNLTSPFNNDKNPLSSDEVEQSYDAKSTNFVVDETMESSPNGPGEATEDGVLCEDSTTYLSALQNTDAQLPSELVNCNDSPEELVDIPEVLDDSSSTDDEPSAFEKPAYDPSAWTPMEIETATGSSECTFMEHRLMLRSTYSEVEDTSGTRDLNGEPQVTSYHRCFFGTVDYIWRTEGLQTVRVLAPIPKHAMQWTPGFPTKKWGSDHIALVTELAFTKDTNNQNAGSPVTD